uniref:Uncharacterized protein n=1 Tax=Callorhinchus milii TaxID=7868 RepID=A0A4W3H0D5_CALMI
MSPPPPPWTDQDSREKRSDRSVTLFMRKVEGKRAWPRLTKEKVKVRLPWVGHAWLHGLSDAPTTPPPTPALLFLLDVNAPG